MRVFWMRVLCVVAVNQNWTCSVPHIPQTTVERSAVVYEQVSAVQLWSNVADRIKGTAIGQHGGDL